MILTGYDCFAGNPDAAITAKYVLANLYRGLGHETSFLMLLKYNQKK